MQVFVTGRAEKNFDSIVDHIRGKWGDKTSKEFIQKVVSLDSFIHTLSTCTKSTPEHELSYSIGWDLSNCSLVADSVLAC